MITLKTLPKATAQEVFEQCAKHMLKQNCRSVNAQGGNAYRGEGGLKCPGGALIADEEYYTIMENKAWTHFNGGKNVRSTKTLVGARLVPRAHAQLIREMQMVHDNVDIWPDQWRDELEMIGFRFELDTNFLHE